MKPQGKGGRNPTTNPKEEKKHTLFLGKNGFAGERKRT